MPISATDLLFFLSGGPSNTDPDLSLGGVISTTQVVDDTLHNVFDKVTGDEALAGKTNYRALFVKNNHGSLTGEDAVFWIQSNTTNSEISVAIADEGVQVSGNIETIADEDTAPVGPVFTQPGNKAAAIVAGDIAAGSVCGWWEKRTIGAATPGENAATFQIKWEMDTQQ